jgi:hypothetical protein
VRLRDQTLRLLRHEEAFAPKFHGWSFTAVSLDRALHYITLRYQAIYAHPAAAFPRDASLTQTASHRFDQ